MQCCDRQTPGRQARIDIRNTERQNDPAAAALPLNTADLLTKTGECESNSRPWVIVPYLFS
jgi:hypothetical protein